MGRWMGWWMAGSIDGKLKKKKLKTDGDMDRCRRFYHCIGVGQVPGKPRSGVRDSNVDRAVGDVNGARGVE